MSPLTGWTFERCDSIASIKVCIGRVASCPRRPASVIASLTWHHIGKFRTRCSDAGGSLPSFYQSACKPMVSSSLASSCPACPASSAGWDHPGPCHPCPRWA
eukprot:3635356-Heterocapsa_arctica.AAC.1